MRHSVSLTYVIMIWLMTERNEKLYRILNDSTILIPVLSYGWKDDNIVEEENSNDGNDVASQTPSRKAIVPAGNLHFGWNEEDQPNHNCPGTITWRLSKHVLLEVGNWLIHLTWKWIVVVFGWVELNSKEHGDKPDRVKDSPRSCPNLLCDVHPWEVEEGDAEHGQHKPDAQAGIVSQLRKSVKILQIKRTHRTLTWTNPSMESSKRPVGPWAQSSETCQ